MDLAQAACAFGPIDPSADGGRGLQVAAMSDVNPVRVPMYMRPSRAVRLDSMPGVRPGHVHANLNSVLVCSPVGNLFTEKNASIAFCDV